MSLSVKKKCVIHYGRGQPMHAFRLNNVTVGYVDVVSDLGILRTYAVWHLNGDFVANDNFVYKGVGWDAMRKIHTQTYKFVMISLSECQCVRMHSFVCVCVCACVYVQVPLYECT